MIASGEAIEKFHLTWALFIPCDRLYKFNLFYC